MRLTDFKLVMVTALLVLINISCSSQGEGDKGSEEEVFRVGYNNPDLVVDLGTGLWGAPVPVDFNDDGLMDIIVTCPSTPYKGVYFYENIGTLSDPLFDVSKKVSDIAYRNIQASYVDNTLHVIRQGKEYLDFATNLYSEPYDIPVDVIPGKDFKKVRSNMWGYVDFDSDGDSDIIVGIDDWGDYGWDNAYDSTGVWMNGPLRGYLYLLENNGSGYTNKGKINAGSRPIESYGAPGANMADLDGDGRLDIICGEFLDKITWYKNIGTKSNPKFAEGSYLQDERDDTIRLHLEMIIPVAVDFDKDGHVDLLVGDEDGRIALVKNTGMLKDNKPIFRSPAYLKQKANNLKFGALTTPYSIDWDGDGDEDIISGNSAGNIAFIRNLGGGEDPVWDKPVLLRSNQDDIRIMAGRNGSIQGPAEEKWGYTTLSVADWDNDGKKDVIVNSIFGKVIWYKNTGDLINLEGPYNVKVDWGEKEVSKPEWNWWNPGPGELVTQWRTTPYAIDWNQDGLTDLVMLDHEGYLAFFERFEEDGQLYVHPGKRIFKEVGEDMKDALLRLNDREAGRSGRIKICFTDWDGDGDIDLLANSKNVEWYENTGETDGFVIFKSNGDLLKRKLAGHTTSPATVDWDKDGVPDLLIGAEDGHFYYFKNK
ncbi:FG-GAP repeat domain-containing protein [Sunxiuqinia sp. A32]|uniref:FG-GAP repeat domain-containing protein n=1 Tax=Sunxiuqinia sp. A32 TaxID=3461496 RepID=UPI0040452351